MEDGNFRSVLSGGESGTIKPNGTIHVLFYVLHVFMFTGEVHDVSIIYTKLAVHSALSC